MVVSLPTCTDEYSADYLREVLFNSGILSITGTVLFSLVLCSVNSLVYPDSHLCLFNGEIPEFSLSSCLLYCHQNILEGSKTE